MTGFQLTRSNHPIWFGFQNHVINAPTSQKIKIQLKKNIILFFFFWVDFCILIY